MYYIVYLFGEDDNDVYGVYLCLGSPKFIHAIDIFWHDKTKIVEDFKYGNLNCRVFTTDVLGRAKNSIRGIVEEYHWEQVENIQHIIKEIVWDTI